MITMERERQDGKRQISRKQLCASNTSGEQTKRMDCVKRLGSDEENGLREEIGIQNFFNGTVGIFCSDWETIV